MFPESEGMKVARSDYQEFRQKAAKTAFDISEFSEDEIIQYDLDEGWTEGEAVPTGRLNPETYTGERPIDKRGTDVDVRTLKNR